MNNIIPLPEGPWGGGGGCISSKVIGLLVQRRFLRFYHIWVWREKHTLEPHDYLRLACI